MQQAARGIRRNPTLWRLRWLLVMGLLSLSGVLYMILFNPGGGFHVGAVFAIFCGMPLILFEREYILQWLHHRIMRLPTPAYIICTLVVYQVLVSLGFAAAGVLLKLTGQIYGSWQSVLIISPATTLYSLASFFLGIFVLRIRQLLGRDVFMSLITGRYRRPLEEERIFLFIDLVGSTTYAETHGDLKAQKFISAVFSSIAEPVLHHGGAIEDYVGDCAIVTWPLGDNGNPRAAIACVFDILSAIEAKAARWQRKFGQVPKLRAALHGGSVVTAEIGVDHHKITYFGDVVNTTARIEALSKTLDRGVLMSSDLFALAELPPGIVAEDLGTYMLKGRDQPLGVIALERG